MAKHGHIHTRFNAHSKGTSCPFTKGTLILYSTTVFVLKELSPCSQSPVELRHYYVGATRQANPNLL